MTERTLAAILAGGLFAATPASADLLMNFQDDRDDATTVPFYVAFGVNTTGGDVFSATGTVGGVSVTLKPNQSYLYSENGTNCSVANTLCGSVDITEASPNARVLVSLGNGLTIEPDGSANFVNPQPGNAGQLLDFQTRWDKFEFDYSAGTGGANLTSTDFFGLPMKLATTQASHPSQTLTWNYSSTVNTTTVFSTLGAKAGYTLDQAPNDGKANLGAIVANGNNGVTITKPDGSQISGVVRVIAPSSTNGGQTPFPSFAPYLSYIENNQVKTSIAGQNGEYNNEWQNYNFTAYISNTTTTINGLQINPGDLVLNGTVTLGTAEDFTIVVAASELSVYNVYGANVKYSASAPDAYHVVEKALADYLAGLNFGFIGSPELNPTTDPAWNGTPIGESPSWTWYGNIPSGGYLAPLPLSDAYAVAQPDNSYYNQYAAELNNSDTPVTDSYGFPYTDRLASPLANLYSDTTLTLTILADKPELGAPAPIPEASTWVMMGLGFAGLAFMGYRAQRKTALAV